MKSHTVKLSLTVPERMEFVNITPDVEQAVLDGMLPETFEPIDEFELANNDGVILVAHQE